VSTVLAMANDNPPQPPVMQQPAIERPELRFARLWSPSDVCWYLGIGKTRLASLRESDATFPEPLVLPGGRLIWWQPAVIAAWATGEPVTPAPTPPPRRTPGRKPRQ
jgi:hypothetical protein